jgi:hypothetical protein
MFRVRVQRVGAGLLAGGIAYEQIIGGAKEHVPSETLIPKPAEVRPVNMQATTAPAHNQATIVVGTW